MISEIALKEFKELYQQEYGKNISDEEALELATNLLTFMDNIYRPIRRDWLVNK